jgi:hypothetical protein
MGGGGGSQSEQYKVVLVKHYHVGAPCVRGTGIRDRSRISVRNRWKYVINNYPVEIMLENEKTAQDVVNSIGDWINQKNLIFIGVDIDGEHYNVDEAPETPVENINLINCLVQSRADVVYDTVNEAIVYCDRVMDFLHHLEDEPMS